MSGASFAEILVRFVHNLGYVFGTGGAFVFNALNRQIETKHPELAKHKQTLFKWPMKFMWIGLIAMVLVHTAEVVVDPTPMHILKAVVIYVVLAGGLYNVKKLAPKVQELAPSGPDEEPSEEFLAAKEKLQRLGLVLLVFWILDFLLNTIAAPAHIGAHF